MPATVKFDPTANSQQAQIIPDATPKNDGVMTKEQAKLIAQMSSNGGAVIWWNTSENWTKIHAKLAAAGMQAIVVVVGDSTNPDFPFTIDASADLSKVQFMGIGTISPGPLVVVAPGVLIDSGTHCAIMLNNIRLSCSAPIATSGASLALALYGISSLTRTADVKVFRQVPDGGVVTLWFGSLLGPFTPTNPMFELASGAFLTVQALLAASIAPASFGGGAGSFVGIFADSSSIQGCTFPGVVQAPTGLAAVSLGGAFTITPIQTGNYDPFLWESASFDTSGGALTANLPALAGVPGVEGVQVRVSNQFPTANNVTVVGSLMSGAPNFAVTPGKSATFEWNSQSSTWLVVSQ